MNLYELRGHDAALSCFIRKKIRHFYYYPDIIYINE